MQNTENSAFYTLEIVQDIDPINPRWEYDNLGKMVCWHRNYILGDDKETRRDDVFGWLAEMLAKLGYERYTEQYDDFIYDLENGCEESAQKAWELISQKTIILPLYLYDHGGITINTSRHYDIFDSGQVGYIYISLEDVRAEYGWTRISQKRRAQIEQYLKDEVHTYAQYLSGEVYGWIVKDSDGEHVDSCWDYFGHEYTKEEGESNLAQHNARKRQEILDLIQKSLDRPAIEELLSDGWQITPQDKTAELEKILTDEVMKGGIPEDILNLYRVVSAW